MHLYKSVFCDFDVSMVIVKDWVSRYSVSTSRRPRVNVCSSRVIKSLLIDLFILPLFSE
jgi:hypothetical protein